MKTTVSCLALLTVLSAFWCLAEARRPTRREAENGVRVMEPEEECLAAGGQCLHYSQCAPDKVSHEAQCTKQKSAGAVCCHSAHPVDEARCEMLAGECKAECAENLRVEQARDCDAGQVCCTLV